MIRVWYHDIIWTSVLKKNNIKDMLTILNKIKKIRTQNFILSIKNDLI